LVLYSQVRIQKVERDDEIFLKTAETNQNSKMVQYYMYDVSSQLSLKRMISYLLAKDLSFKPFP
jgi:hypothetical protein